MPTHTLQSLFADRSPWRVTTWVVALVILSFALSSCQAITRIKCNTKNWNKAGQKDGAAGKLAEETFLSYASECSASGAEIDKSVYMAGYQEGLVMFCTLESGVAQARDGFENRNLCTAQFGPAFDEGFAQGLDELCDASGGQQFGLKGGVYRGTCPAETEQEFLTSYLNAINAALPEAFAEVTILEGKANSLQSDIGSLEIQMGRYDSAINTAKKNNNKAWEDQLENDKSDVSSRLTRLRMDQSQTERDLSKARKKTQTLQEMLVKWKLQLDV